MDPNNQPLDINSNTPTDPIIGNDPSPVTPAADSNSIVGSTPIPGPTATTPTSPDIANQVGSTLVDGEAKILESNAPGIADAADAPEVAEPPIEPAAPVPGSIGSVTSVPPVNEDPVTPPAITMTGAPASPTATPNSEPIANFNQSPTSPEAPQSVPNAPAPASPIATAPQPSIVPPKPKSHTTLILIIIIIVLALVGIGIATFMILSSSKQAVTPTPTPTPTTTELLCSVDSYTDLATGEEIPDIDVVSAIDAGSEILQFNKTYTFSLTDSQIDQINIDYNWIYPDTDSANKNFEALVSQLKQSIIDAGFTVDPLATEYLLEDTTIVASQSIVSTDLTEKNLKLTDLSLTKDSKIPATTDEVTTQLEAYGYICEVE